MAHSIIGLALAVACLLAGGSVHAATFTVTSMADSGPGTLRDAIIRANAAALGPTHRIEFATGGTIVLASELPGITTNLVIDGGGRSVTVSGNSLVPIMRVSTLNQLTLRRLHLSKAVRYAVRSSAQVWLEDSSIQAVNGAGVTVGGGSATIARSNFHKINGTAVAAGWLRLDNSTFTSNTAVNDPVNFKYGAVIALMASHTAHGIANVTISGTSLTPGTAVIAPVEPDAFYGSLRNVLTNTIITNTAGGSECRLPALPSYEPATYYDGGGNLGSDSSCGFSRPTSLVGVSAMLGPLQDNGGPTLTMQPLAGSPAINGGVASTLTTDQRGYARLSGAAVDKGAVEVAGTLGLRGFFLPVRNWPLFNDAQAGRLVPVRFGFNGYQGMAVLAQGYPQSAPVTCTTGPFSPVDEYAQAGGGGLTYDTKTDAYQYVLATQTVWKGTCRRLTFRFIDGSSIDAYFRFN